MGYLPITPCCKRLCLVGRIEGHNVERIEDEGGNKIARTGPMIVACQWNYGNSIISDGARAFGE